MDSTFTAALQGLETYDVLGPFAVVEALTRLQRIACAAHALGLSYEELWHAAQQVMDAHWVEDGLPAPFLDKLRAEVLLRLGTMLECCEQAHQQGQERFELLDSYSVAV